WRNFWRRGRKRGVRRWFMRDYAAGLQPAQGGKKLRPNGGLLHELEGSGADRFFACFGGVMQAEQDDLNAGETMADCAGGMKAVETGILTSMMMRSGLSS